MATEKDIAQALVALIKEDPDFIAEMGDRLFSMYADQGTVQPFATYAIGELEKLSKDDGGNYPVTISLCYDPRSYMKMLEFEEKMLALFEANGYEVLASDPVFVDEKSLLQVRNINLSVQNDGE